jgi:hypothetical protein
VASSRLGLCASLYRSHHASLWRVQNQQMNLGKAAFPRQSEMRLLGFTAHRLGCSASFEAVRPAGTLADPS